MIVQSVWIFFFFCKMHKETKEKEEKISRKQRGKATPPVKLSNLYLQEINSNAWNVFSAELMVCEVVFTCSPDVDVNEF